MLAKLQGVNDRGTHYDAIQIWCPGCERVDEEGSKFGGLHMLPVSDTGGKRPVWGWNGSLVKVTLTPSILSWNGAREAPTFVCHSFLVDGVWQFLGDCTHSLVNQHVSMVDLPDWIALD